MPPGDVDALARAVRRLADDAGLRARLREGGLATAAQYDEAKFLAALEREAERVAGTG